MDESCDVLFNMADMEKLTADGIRDTIYPMEKVKVKIRESRDCKECWVFGITCLPDGGWLLVDDNNKTLKRLNASNSLVDYCDFRCPDMYGVCYVPEENVAVVALGRKNNLEVVSLGGKMKRVRTISTRHHCYGVTHSDGKLSVTAVRGQEIYQHSVTEGTLLTTICPEDDQGQKRFSETGYIAADETGIKLFVTDRFKGLFILDTKTGSVLLEVNIGKALDICLGPRGSILVSMLAPWEIVRVDGNGNILSKVVTADMMDGHRPDRFCFDRNTDRMAVASYQESDSVFIFSVKQK